MQQAKDRLGREGEELAVGYLEDLGMTVIDRNWRCDRGEIDIVARDGETLVICEVKTRSGLGFGAPLTGVDQRKLQRLWRLTTRWIATHDEPAPQVRVDLVGVLLEPDKEPRFDYLPGVT